MSKKILLRNSERRAFMRCRLAWHWEWEQGLKPISSKPALTFGDLVHQALEKYYKKGRKRGPHPRKTFKKVYDKLTLEQGYKLGMKIRGVDEDDDEMIWTAVRDLGVTMLNGYVEEYGPEDNIEILVPEMPFKVDLNHPKTGKYLVTVVGKLDAPYRDHSKKRKPVGIIDHKTAASIRTDHLTLDEQAGTYFEMAPIFLKNEGLMDEKEKLTHIMFNILRKGMPDERPKNELGQALNKDGSVSKVQPAPLFARKEVIRSENEGLNLTQRIIQQAWEMQQVRKGKLPIYKNPMRDCASHCGFFGVCELHEAGSDWEDLLEISTKSWNPHADHELTRKE